MDYIDEMIKAELHESVLWKMEVDLNTGLREIWRDGKLVEKLDGAPYPGFVRKFFDMSKRAAMEAAFEAAYFQKYTPAPSCIDPNCLNGKNVVLHQVKPIIPSDCYESFMRPDLNMRRFIDKFAKNIPEPAPEFEMPDLRLSETPYGGVEQQKIDWLALNRSCSE